MTFVEPVAMPMVMSTPVVGGAGQSFAYGGACTPNTFSRSQYITGAIPVAGSVTTMAAPAITTLAGPPISTMAAAPISTMAARPVSPAHQRVQPARATAPARDLLSMGTLIQTNHLTRDDLIRTGHLFPDIEKEAQIQRQHEMRPGAMAGPHSTLLAGACAGGSIMQAGMQGGVQGGSIMQAAMQSGPYGSPVEPTAHGAQGVVGTTGAAVYPAQSHGEHKHAAAHEQAAPRHGHKTETLEVSILHARNLQHMNMTGDHWYVVCEAKRPPGFPAGKTGKCTTHHIPKTPDPAWNELHHMEHWNHGDDLEFTVYDKGLISSKTQGKVKLSHTQFYPDGWEGELPLDCGHNSVLGIRVVPLGNPEQQGQVPGQHR